MSIDTHELAMSDTTMTSTQRRAMKEEQLAELKRLIEVNNWSLSSDAFEVLSHPFFRKSDHDEDTDDDDIEVDLSDDSGSATEYYARRLLEEDEKE